MKYSTQGKEDQSDEMSSNGIKFEIEDCNQLKKDNILKEEAPHSSDFWDCNVTENEEMVQSKNHNTKLMRKFKNSSIIKQSYDERSLNQLL